RENIVITAGSGRLVAGTLIAPITADNALTATAACGSASWGEAEPTSCRGLVVQPTPGPAILAGRSH
ncbi:hypothetical protein WA846_24210, partial [Pseudomonas aeruginosa]